VAGERGADTSAEFAVLHADGVSRRFGDNLALDEVSLRVHRGEIHALLGPNGAGKTTLIRTLTGLVTPNAGVVRVTGRDPTRGARAVRERVGVVPSGDRSFYLRMSGLENLAFFARLYGFSRRRAVSRARTVLGEVDLLDAARVRVGVYSHGMQKRLSVARALLTEPPALLVDEATHDLDPEGALRVRDLVRRAASGGAAVLWATQRVDEIRGFADRVTLLHQGRVRFVGTVPQLISLAAPRRHVVRLRNGAAGTAPRDVLSQALAGTGVAWAEVDGDPEHYLLSLPDGVVLGDALAALTAAEVEVLACREERSQIEEAFLALTAQAPR
jgi:ABC-2 type transport system ATP-binding protein